MKRLVAALERADIQVKRELDTETESGPLEVRRGGDVRVMTVHGAKGLEAPIVILPDTTSKPPPHRGALLKTEAGGFLFAPRKADDCEASAEARELAERRAAEEQLRLLYVALTRARDRVIVTGRLSARGKGRPPALVVCSDRGGFHKDRRGGGNARGRGTGASRSPFRR